MDDNNTAGDILARWTREDRACLEDWDRELDAVARRQEERAAVRDRGLVAALNPLLTPPVEVGTRVNCQRKDGTVTAAELTVYREHEDYYADPRTPCHPTAIGWLVTVQPDPSSVKKTPRRPFTQGDFIDVIIDPGLDSNDAARYSRVLLNLDVLFPSTEDDLE